VGKNAMTIVRGGWYGEFSDAVCVAECVTQFVAAYVAGRVAVFRVRV